MSTKDQSEPNKIETRGLLAGAAAAFVAGLGGAVWHTKRKQAKEAASTSMNNNIATHPYPSLQQSTVSSQLQPQPAANQQPIPSSMTPEEYAVSKRQARFFAFKALGYGTLLALTGAGALSLAVGWWLDVSNFKEFSDRLHEIVPVQTRRLRRMLGGSEFVLKPGEKEELDRALETEE
ncbi:predicted protein [Lichtheimia corymbifera JMRC:FSU:9682]|uniref:Uncharacterized protein n=1 Tax=Lichtheimia corymbifera JMRC:FSU:9682 TaxID=1263082 RepID=A0A068RYP4_9FUNG|nr:predicted protein [Lichtheimia corymbifera JMRC:FSU:9682]CDH59621.1 predicted protein [Lichtheimia corymbifera JMRC:FSU:9682]